MVKLRCKASTCACPTCPTQVLPFILRRTKEAVLSDLPPKILQDVFVDLSPLQRRLYEDFGRSPASAEIASAAGNKAPHVFQVRPSKPYTLWKFPAPHLRAPACRSRPLRLLEPPYCSSNWIRLK